MILEEDMADARRAAPILEVRGLDVYYGSSHALQGVDLTLDSGVLSVVGRNGMGKTTLCKTIMGLVRATGGSVRMGGEDLLSLQPAQIARLGVGYVPQGRRLWRSLTVDEHLRMIAGMRRGAWNVERIYDTFPRLAERKNNGGAQLSGGEQQMLAIARALVTNPRLLIMDEPTEGLAPVIVAQVEEMLVRLGEEGDIAVLVIEQNIGVATAVSRNVAIMVNGRVNRLIESSRLASDRDLQQRLLGVGRHADAGSEIDAEAKRATQRRVPLLRGRRVLAPTQGLHFESVAADPMVAARADRAHRGGRTDAFERRVEASGDRAAAPRRIGRPKLRTADRARRGHAGYQGRGTPVHPRHRRRQRLARAARRCLDQRQALDLRCLRPGNCAQPFARRRRRVRSGSRRLGDGDGRGLHQLAATSGRHRRRDLGRRVGRRFAGVAGHARAPDRRAEAHHLLGRLGRYCPLCRTRRHHHDVLGHRRAGAELDFAPGAGQWRQRAGRHGEGAARRASGKRPRGERRPAVGRPDDVRRHDAGRAADHRGACAGITSASCSMLPAPAASRWRSWWIPACWPG